jgi:hypothetical protein
MSHATEPESPAAEGLLPGVAEIIARARVARRPHPQSGRFDAAGRLLPVSDEERARRSEHLRRLFEEWERQPPDPTDSEEIWEQVMRGIDEERPHRKLFEGYY